jgi:ABC-2 type transport system ATP-binding protein
MFAIECQNLSKRYRRSVPAVSDLNLNIAPRQVYGFLGPNGAGKTTTIRLLLGLIRPSSGGVRLFGEPVNPKALKKVGALVEGASFYPYLSGWDNLRVFAWTLGQFDAERAHSLLELVSLHERAHDPVRKYSTGMKQRLGIAAALLHDPDLLILDEPTNGLDPGGIRAMRALIRQLVDDHGKTIFLSSHLLGEVQQICDHVGIINGGRLLAEGTVAALLSQPSAQYLVMDVSPVESAHAALSQRWQVSSSDDPGKLTVSAMREEIPEVVRALVAADVALFGLQHQQVSLEDFFLSITKSEEAIALETDG